MGGWGGNANFKYKKFPSGKSNILTVVSLPLKAVTYFSLGVNCIEYGQSFSCVCFSATPWTVAHQAPLSMELSRQEY